MLVYYVRLVDIKDFYVVRKGLTANFEKAGAERTVARYLVEFDIVAYFSKVDLLV